MRRASWAAGVAGALLLAACGDDATATPSAVDVTGIDYGYEGLPETVAAGTEIAFSNVSQTEVHEFVALRLADDDDRTAEEILALPPDELGPMMAEVSSVIIAPPEADGMVVEGTAALEQAGRYVIFCAIPIGADPDEYLAAAAEAEGGPPDVAGGPPHFVEGMWAEVVVE